VTISARGLALICQFEDCKLQAYPDPATGGEPFTIGYGCTGGVTPGMRITFAQALEMLKDHLVPLEVQLEHLIKVPLSQNAYDALVSLVWNIGIGNFEHSTLLQELNAGHMTCAADEFLKWTRAAGKFMPGLLRRREAERELFLRG
jgi:lysozyme